MQRSNGGCSILTDSHLWQVLDTNALESCTLKQFSCCTHCPQQLIYLRRPLSLNTMYLHSSLSQFKAAWTAARALFSDPSVSQLFYSFLLFLTAHASAVWLFNVLWENHNNQCYVNVRVPYVYFLRNYHNLYQFKIIHRAWQRREGGKDAAVCCVFSLDFFLWSRRRAHAAHD